MKLTDILVWATITVVIVFVAWLGVSLAQHIDTDLSAISTYNRNMKQSMRQCIEASGEPITAFFGLEYVACREEKK